MINKLGEFELNKIYCIDCLEGLKNIPNKSVNCIIADPPYNVGQKFANDNLEKKEYLKFMSKWIKEAYRILKDNGSFYMFHYFLGMWKVKPILDRYDWKFLNLIIWTYPNMMPSNKRLKNRYPLSYQPIFYYGKNFEKDLMGKLFKSNIPERKDVWTMTATQRNFKKEFRFHPSCKPLKLIRKIVFCATEKDDIVIDPFIGSGTTAVACKQLSRKFISFEINPEYVKIANKRLAQEILK